MGLTAAGLPSPVRAGKTAAGSNYGPVDHRRSNALEHLRCPPVFCTFRAVDRRHRSCLLSGSTFTADGHAD